MKKINLENRKKINTPFKAPENYFESMTTGIQERIREQPAVATIPAFQLKWIIAPVLVAIIVLSILWIPQPTPPQANMDQLLNKVSDEEIEEYLAFTQVTEYEIAKVIESVDEIPDSDTYLEGIELNEGDIEDILMEFDLHEQPIDS